MGAGGFAGLRVALAGELEGADGLFLFLGFLVGEADLVKYYRIPNKILLFLLIAGLTINLLYNIIAWDMAFLGMFGSGAFLFLLRFVGNRMLKKETLGMGDVKLGTVVGFYLGFTDFLTALLTGSLLAIIISVLLTHSPAMMIKARIPLAPYLTIGVLLVLLFS